MKRKLLSAILALCMVFCLLPTMALADDSTSYITVGGIAGFSDQKFASFEAAYNAIKPELEKLGGLVEQPATNTAFDALFTNQDANGSATITYTIHGAATYDETGLSHLLTMGRAASHYSTERHLIKFKFVGADENRGATLAVNSDITLPYEWWDGDTTAAAISFENLTITGSAPSGLFATQAYLQHLDFTINNCTLTGIKVYGYVNTTGSYTITNSTLDGTGTASDAYAIHLQGSSTDPLQINISGNDISGYDRGINIDQATANATISGNMISVKDSNRSCIQLTQLAETTISDNTLNLTGGNAFTFHGDLAENSKITINNGNKILGTGHLIYDNTNNEIDLTFENNLIAPTVDKTSGIYNGEEKPLTDAVKEIIQEATKDDLINVILPLIPSLSPSETIVPALNTADHTAYVAGYPNGTVSPSGSITRAETAAILFRLMTKESRKEFYATSNRFYDVSDGAWYNTYVSTLARAGVIVDSSNGYFRPDDAITRAELASMLAQFAGGTAGASRFSDVSSTHWASTAIARISYLGWIKGYPDGTFRPDQSITRAEMMAMMNRALGRAPETASDILPGAQGWKDNQDTSSWYYLDVLEATNSHDFIRRDAYETWTGLLANPDWSQYE